MNEINDMPTANENKGTAIILTKGEIYDIVSKLVHNTGNENTEETKEIKKEVITAGISLYKRRLMPPRCRYLYK